MFNLDSEYPHIRNASDKKTQMRHLWSQEPAKVDKRFFSHKWANVMCFRHCKQDDFANQIYVLESMIWEAGHEYIFLPKFQCELNPIEMVLKSKISSLINLFYVIYFYSIGDGLNIGTDR